MKATKSLPGSYIYLDKFGPKQNKKLTTLGLIFCFISIIPWYLFWFWITRIISPDFGMRLGVNPNPSKYSVNVKGPIETLVFLVLIIVFHEAIHSLFLFVVTNDRPKIIVNWWSAHVEYPGWYISRNSIVVVNTSPFFIFAIVGVILLLVLPVSQLWFVTFGLVLNSVLSMSDLIGTGFFLLLPSSALITTKGQIYIDKSNVSDLDQDPSYNWEKGKYFKLIIDKLN